MEKPVSIELPKLDDKRETSMSVSLFDIGTNCGEPVKITLPKRDDKRQTAYDVSFYPATFPSVDSLTKITLPKLDDKRQTAYDIELLPMECGGLNNCTCFYGKISGIGDLGDYHMVSTKVINPVHTFEPHETAVPPGTPIGRHDTGYLGLKLEDESQTEKYVRGQTSFIKVTDSADGSQNVHVSESFDIVNHRGEVTGQDNYSDSYSSNYVGFKPTVAWVKQRGTTFYGNPFWLPYGYEAETIRHADFQPVIAHGLYYNNPNRFNTSGSADFDVGRGSSWQSYEPFMPNHYQGKSTDDHYDPTDYSFNDRQLGGGLIKRQSFFGQILVDGVPFDLADFYEQCDYFSPADIVIDDVTLDKDNSKNYITTTKLDNIYNFDDSWSFDAGLEENPSIPTVNDSNLTHNAIHQDFLGVQYWWHFETNYSLLRKALYRWWDDDNNTIYRTSNVSFNTSCSSTTTDIGDIWFKKANYSGDLYSFGRQATHNSLMFVLVFGAHFKKKFPSTTCKNVDDKRLDDPWDAPTIDVCGTDYGSGTADTYLGVGWGLYLVHVFDKETKHQGPFSVTDHMSESFELVDDGGHIKVQTKTKEIDTTNDDDVKWLQDFKDKANTPPHSQKLSWTKVENIKPHSEILQYQGVFSYPTETQWDNHDEEYKSQYIYSAFADFYSPDWVGDNPFDFSVNKNKRCSSHPPVPWMQLWVYYCDGTGDPYPRGDNWVRLDWDFEEKKYVSGSEEYLFPMEIFGWSSGFADNNPTTVMGRLTIEKKDGVFKLEYIKGMGSAKLAYPNSNTPNDITTKPQYADIDDFKGLYHEPQKDDYSIVPGPNSEILYATDVTGYYAYDTVEEAKDSLNVNPPQIKFGEFWVTERDPEYGAGETAYPLVAKNL